MVARPAALGLGSASDGPLSWTPGLGVAEGGARHAQQWTEVGMGGATGDGSGGAAKWCKRPRRATWSGERESGVGLVLEKGAALSFF